MHCKKATYRDWQAPAAMTSAAHSPGHVAGSVWPPQADASFPQTWAHNPAIVFPPPVPGAGSAPVSPGSGPPRVGPEPLGGGVADPQPRGGGRLWNEMPSPVHAAIAQAAAAVKASWNFMGV